MKKFFGSLALAAALAGPAMAADMPLKAPPPVTYYDWSGFYLGFSAGWVNSHYNWQFTSPVAPVALRSFSDNVTDAIFDIHAGVQWQWYHIVIGGEVGYNIFGWGNHTNTLGGTAFGAFTLVVPAQTCQVAPRDILTAGGRLGWAWDNWLIYGTGGGAWGSVHSQIVGVTGALVDFSQDSRRSGWYAGGGFEYVLHRGPIVDVIVGAEYQHIDLKTDTHLSNLDAFVACPPGVFCRNISATEDIARARLTIKTHGWDIFYVPPPAAPAISK